METKAYLIIHDKLSALAHITGYTERFLNANEGWVAIIDYRYYYPKKVVCPKWKFEEEYPNTPLTILV